jgi:hypothetical protein
MPKSKSVAGGLGLLALQNTSSGMYEEHEIGKEILPELFMTLIATSCSQPKYSSSRS